MLDDKASVTGRRLSFLGSSSLARAARRRDGERDSSLTSVFLSDKSVRSRTAVKRNRRHTQHALDEGSSPTDERNEEVERSRGQWRLSLRAISAKRRKRGECTPGSPPPRRRRSLSRTPALQAKQAVARSCVRFVCTFSQRVHLNKTGVRSISVALKGETGGNGVRKVQQRASRRMHAVRAYYDVEEEKSNAE